jgi:hypothetical protein
MGTVFSAISENSNLKISKILNAWPNKSRFPNHDLTKWRHSPNVDWGIDNFKNRHSLSIEMCCPNQLWRVPQPSSTIMSRTLLLAEKFAVKDGIRQTPTGACHFPRQGDKYLMKILTSFFASCFSELTS